MAETHKWAYRRGLERGREEAMDAMRELIAACKRAADLLDEVNSNAAYYGADFSYYVSYSGRGTRAIANRLEDEWSNYLEHEAP